MKLLHSVQHRTGFETLEDKKLYAADLMGAAAADLPDTPVIAGFDPGDFVAELSFGDSSSVQMNLGDTAVEFSSRVFVVSDMAFENLSGQEGEPVIETDLPNDWLSQVRPAAGIAVAGLARSPTGIVDKDTAHIPMVLVKLIQPTDVCIKNAEYHAERVIDSNDCPTYQSGANVDGVHVDCMSRRGPEGVMVVYFSVQAENLEALKVDLQYQNCQFEVLNIDSSHTELDE